MRAFPLLLATLLTGVTAVAINTLAKERNVLPPAGGRTVATGELSSLTSATEWLNSPPLTAAGLEGKVVLVEFWTYSRAGGKIVYRFHARDLHLVMGPAERGRPVRFRVLIDGKPPGASHGVDVDAEGFGTLAGQRMYQLIRQKGSIDHRLFEIQFLDAGTEAFAFTFG